MEDPHPPAASGAAGTGQQGEPVDRVYFLLSSVRREVIGRM